MPAGAQDKALLRVVDIRVELAQDSHNLRVGKLTSEEQARCSEALNSEARTLLAPHSPERPGLTLAGLLGYAH